VQRLPRRGMSPRRFSEPPLSLALRAICNMKNVRLAFLPPCLWVPKTPGGGTRLEIGAFYHRLAGGSSKRHPVLTIDTFR
jgi:hypothetical protein